MKTVLWVYVSVLAMHDLMQERTWKASVSCRRKWWKQGMFGRDEMPEFKWHSMWENEGIQ